MAGLHSKDMSVLMMYTKSVDDRTLTHCKNVRNGTVYAVVLMPITMPAAQ